MRSRALAVIGVLVLVLGAAAFWWHHGTQSEKARSTPSASSHAAPKLPTERGGPTGVVIEDDVRGTLRLEGQVVDAGDEPVKGATVVLGSNPPRTATTEADGSFAFDDLIGRPYTLIARAAQGVAGPVTSKLTAKSEPVILHLHAAGKVTVTVTDSANHPIDGATVELRGVDHQTQTSKAGTAVFAPVVPGAYQLVAYTPVLARAATFVVVGVGETTAKLVLAPGARVAGKVVDDHGAPVAGARVAFQGASDFMARGDSRYDGVDTAADGTFAFAAIGAGSFRFTASHPAYAPGTSELFTLDGKTEHTGVTITLAAGAVVRGRVIDASRQPVAGARVRVAVSSRRGLLFEPPRQTYSAADGSFEVRGLGRRELAAFAIAETGASQTKDVDTTRGDVAGVELVIDVTGTISGIVIDPNGQPIEGVQVSASPSFDGFGSGGTADFTQLRLRGPSEDLSDAGGHFTLVGLATGSYRVSATRSRRLGRFRGGGFGGPGGDSVVAQTGTRDLKITLEPEGGVKGKVLMADGSVPTAFTVSIGGTEQSFTGVSAFELDGLVPQHYSLQVTGPMFVPGGADVTVPAGTTVDAGTITVQPGRTLGGTVVAAGTPVPNATVYAGTQVLGNGTTSSMNLGPFAAGTKSTTTGTDGTFSLSGLGQGDLTLTADEPTYGRSKALRVPADAPGQSQIVLQLMPPGTLGGIVTAGGKPVEGTFVSCQSTTTPGSIAAVATGPDGSYQYDRLAADTYKVSATIGMPLVGMKFYSKVVTVPSGGSVRADLAADGGALTLDVTVAPSNGTLGLAMAWLANGVITAHTMADLSLQMAAAGPGASQLALGHGSTPVAFGDVSPGAFSVCVVPFPTEVQGMAAMAYAQAHGPTLTAYCQPVLVAPAPTTQTATVSVVIPAYIPGGGSGS